MTIALQHAGEFTAELANELLSDALGEEIVACSVAPLGEGVGLMSAIARAQLTLASGKRTSVVVKVIAQTENVGISKQLNFYANEINFYRFLADQCPIKSPRCLFADIDSDTQDFLLVLEDLGAAAAGDQLKGCDESLMLKSFENAGRLHGRFWGETEQFPWLIPQSVPEINQFRQDAIYRPGVAPTIENFSEYFTGNLAEVVTRIGEQFTSLFERAMSGPETVIHGDYRIDNMLLPEVDGEVEIVGVDWQNTTRGCGPHDIAYFSGQSCGMEMRGDIEMAALRRYYDVLKDEGVKDFSFDECVDYYRLNLMITMITPIAICGTLDPGNERGVELGRIILERSLSALSSMQCADLLH
ncbi:MAG: phosphotransferase [Pseudomonadales bacterium]